MAKVVILAGGLGKRLRPLTIDKPKPLVEIAGRPIIEWQILYFKSMGYTDFVILAGYKWEKLVEHLGSGRRFGVRIAYVLEDEPLGTGGAIKNASHILESEEYFIVVNGDIITNLSVDELVKRLNAEAQTIGVIALVPLRSPYGIVEVGDNDRILRFVEKPMLSYWINAGVYAFKPEILKWLPDKGDIELKGFPELAREGRLAGVRFYDVFWRSIDTVKDLEEVSEQLERIELFRKLSTPPVPQPS